MNQIQILDKLREIITPYLDHSCEMEMYTDLFRDLAINSIDFVNIIAEIEDMFQCSISEDEMLEVHTVGDIVRNIMKHTI